MTSLNLSHVCLCVLFSMWSQNGSITNHDTVDKQQQTCAFNHLTTFAVLFDFSDFSEVMYKINNTMLFYSIMFFVVSKPNNRFFLNTCFMFYCISCMISKTDNWSMWRQNGKQLIQIQTVKKLYIQKI